MRLLHRSGAGFIALWSLSAAFGQAKWSAKACDDVRKTDQRNIDTLQTTLDRAGECVFCSGCSPEAGQRFYAQCTQSLADLRKEIDENITYMESTLAEHGCSRVLKKVHLPASERDWAASIAKTVSEFMACKSAVDDLSECNVFLGRALAKVYGFPDFVTAGKPNQPLTADRIASYVANSNDWVLLGKASKQETLNEAQADANLGRAVIAVYSANPHGHVALILPGDLQPSGWNLLVPNSASFFMDDPKDAYVNGPLSRAFRTRIIDEVLLYGRVP